MTLSKRHHHVPKFYLERFATSGLVFVRRRNGARFTAQCLNVAVESGFYDYEMPNGTKSKAVEEKLASYEATAASILRAIDDTLTAPASGSEERRMLSHYLGLQLSRTPEERERALFPEYVDRFLDGRTLTRELMSEYLEQHYLGSKPAPREVEGAFVFAQVALNSGVPFTPELAMDAMFESLEKVAPLMQSMWWTVEHDRKSRLISSDSPLVLWRAPRPSDICDGVGVADCDEIRFPISPRAQLVLSRKQRPPSARITTTRSAECNAEMARTCHNFVFSNPSSRSAVESLHLRRKRPVQRFDAAPLIKEYPDGTRENSEVLHIWVPR